MLCEFQKLASLVVVEYNCWRTSPGLARALSLPNVVGEDRTGQHRKTAELNQNYTQEKNLSVTRDSGQGMWGGFSKRCWISRGWREAGRFHAHAKVMWKQVSQAVAGPWWISFLLLTANLAFQVRNSKAAHSGNLQPSSEFAYSCNKDCSNTVRVL